MFSSLLCGGFLVYAEPGLELLNGKCARLNSAPLEMRIVGIILPLRAQAEQDQSPDVCSTV